MIDEWEEGQAGWRSRAGQCRGVGEVAAGTVISLGPVCVCAGVQVVCDLLAFVMEMGPAGPTR